MRLGLFCGFGSSVREWKWIHERSFYYQSRALKDSKRIRLNFFILRNFQRVFLLEWFVYVCLSLRDQFPSVTGCLKWFAWLFALKKTSQIVEMSEQNEFTFRIMVISFPFVFKVLEKCRFVWGLSLFIVSLTLHRIAQFWSVFETVVDCSHEKQRRIEEISSEINVTSGWRLSYFPLLYLKTIRAPFRLKVDNLIAHFASVAVLLFVTSSTSRSRRASWKAERKGKYHS